MLSLFTYSFIRHILAYMFTQNQFIFCNVIFQLMLFIFH